MDLPDQEALMYGTIAHFFARPGEADALAEAVREEESRGLPGFLGTYLYRQDRNPEEFYMAVLFESREAYLANAGSEEQHQSYLRMRALMADDPEWHDGEVSGPLPPVG